MSGLLILAGLPAGCGSLKSMAYSGPFRDGWQQPDRVIQELGIRPGMAIADIGAGGGYFTFRFARQVGSSGQVNAVDVDPDMLELLRRRAADQKLKNIRIVRATFTDSKLAPDSVDLIFLCNTYHHIEQRDEYFGRLKAKLKPGGRLAIIDFKPRAFFGFLGPHATEAATIQTEIEKAGYRLERQPAFLKRQNFLIFSKVES